MDKNLQSHCSSIFMILLVSMIFSEILKDLDVFEEQKKKALTDSSGAILILMNYLMSVVGDIENGHADIDREKLFKQFMQVN